MTELLWSFGRISGIVSLVLLTVTVVLGVLTRSGRPLPGLPRFAVGLVHRNAALLSVVFLALHVGTLMFDEYAKLSLIDLVVPFAGAYRPFWQGLGTVAFDLLLAVVITSLLRRRLGPRVFRAVHWLTYAMWPIALVHGVGNGTDAGAAWFTGITLVCVIAVVAALAVRLVIRAREGRGPDTAIAATRTRDERPAGELVGSTR